MFYDRFAPTLALTLVGCLPLAVLGWAQEVEPPAAPAEPAAASAEADAAAPPTEAEAILDEAIAKIQALQSVSANIHQRVQMLGQRFEMTGQYLKSTNHRVFLRLTLSGLGDATGTMLQVCDGRTLWEFQQILDSQSYSRMEITPVLAKLDEVQVATELRQQILASMGFAGPEALLVGLRQAIRFDSKEAGTLDERPVWILRGEWQNREALAGPGQPPLPPTGPLPAYVPSRATVWIGQEDGWPYQVQLAGQRPSVLMQDGRLSPDGRPIGREVSPEVEPSRVLLTYSNVALDADLRPESFAFQAPPDVPVQDRTEAFLAFLEQGLAAHAALERAQAEGPGETLLDQTIPLPPTLPSSPGAEGLPPSPTLPLSPLPQ